MGLGYIIMKVFAFYAYPMISSNHMNIIYLDRQSRSVTGGHKYNDEFEKYLSEITGEKIIDTPSCAELYPSWHKLLSPFMELKRLSLFKKDSLVFFGDTSYKHHFLLLLIARLLKKTHPVIIIHHFSFLGEMGFKRWLQKRMMCCYISMCERIIVPSPYTLDIAKQLFPKKRVYYIPLPFERKYKPSENYKKGNFLYVGTVDERKGIKYLIEALSQIRKLRPSMSFVLNIVGKISDEIYYSRIREDIERFGLSDSVHFRGRVSDEELEQYYNDAEIFTFPSLLEGYGIVLVEAMNHGVPVIAFNNSAMPYSIQDGVNGFLADNKNAKSFAEKILLLSGNKQLRAQLQEGIKESVDSLKTLEDFEEGIREFYHNMNH